VAEIIEEMAAEITEETTEEIVANSTEETTEQHPNNPSLITTGPVQNAQIQTLHFGKSATNVMLLVRAIQQVKTAAETTAEATEVMIANLTEETVAEITAEATEVMIANLTEETVAEITAETTVQLPKKTLLTMTGPVQNVQTQILVSEKSATNVMHLEREVQERGMLVIVQNLEINAQIKEGNKNLCSNTESQGAKVQIMHIIAHQRKLGIEDLKMMIFEGLM